MAVPQQTIMTYTIPKTQARTLILSFDAAWCRIEGYLPEYLKAQLKSKLTYQDSGASYLRSQRNLRVDTNRCIFNEKTQSFPTGLVPSVVGLLEFHNFNYEINNQVPPAERLSLQVPDWFYHHQGEIIRTGLTQRRGLIQAPTGSGKTIAMAGITAHFPQGYVLVTVPSKDLLEQTAVVLEEMLQEPIGRVGNNQKNWQRVTVGIINSLSKAAVQTPQYFERVQVLLVDESHHGASSMYQEVGNVCRNTDVRLGFSGTQWRSSGDDIVLEGVLGPLIYRIEAMTLIERGVILKPGCYSVLVPDPNLVYPNAIRKRHSNGQVSVSYNTRNGKPSDQDVYRLAIVENDQRNHLILDALQLWRESTRRRGPAVVLVKWEEHAQRLCRLAAERGMALDYVSGDPKLKHKRKQMLDLLRKNQLDDVVFTPILNEGTDIPCLEAIFQAGGGASDWTTLQQVGRVVRLSEGKERALFIDFADQERFYLNRHFRERVNAILEEYPDSYQFLPSLDELRAIL